MAYHSWGRSMSGRTGICGLGKRLSSNSLAIHREHEYNRIVASFLTFDVPLDLQSDVRQALLDRDTWDWFRDCDGCTGVSEVYWPTIYFPPCLRHDYDCQRGANGWETTRRFYRLMRAYRMTRVRAGARAVGVFAAWCGWFRWRQRDLP